MPQRVGGDNLALDVRIPAQRISIRLPRLVPEIERIFGLPLIPAVVIGDHDLDPGIADVLQPFVIRTVHVGVHRTQPGGSPADVHDPVKLLNVRFKGCVHLKRVPCKGPVEIIDDQGRILRLDAQFHIPVGPPAQTGEVLHVGSVRDDGIHPPGDGLPFDVVPVVLRPVFIIQTFRVGNDNGAVLSAAEDQCRVCIRQK